MSVVIEARGLALVRGGRLLFEGVDLSLDNGDGLHLTGPNGCGKSSLIRLIAGLLSPAAGTIQRADASLADEHLALDRELPLGRALAFWRGPRLGDAMAAFDLVPIAQVPVRMLSTGQGGRARLARVMASGVCLWLLDEPLNGLDAAGSDQLIKAIAAHRASGGAVVTASHLPLAGDWQMLELGA
ncbi:MAG: ATP-binding cassette domain-containing protein [Sphingomonas bacterium]|nr:ATP-binding cassette domain-containing protein [Sphingomonas bacterium]